MGYFSNIYTFLEKSRPIEKAANALKGNCPGYTKKKFQTCYEAGT
jgi:hypothetical protein